MLKCDSFLGCFGNCDETINTGIISDFSGEITYEFEFDNVLHKKTLEVAENEEIILPNIFPPAMLHRVKIAKNGTKIKNISFKIHTQCL